MRWTCGAVSGLVLILAGQPAWAQGGDVGVAVGYPGAIGVLWHITDRVAIRPDVSVIKTSTDSTSQITTALPPGLVITPTTSSSEGWGSTSGVSLLFSVGEVDDVRFYLTPRVAYLHSSSDSENSASGFGASTTTTTSSTSKGWLAAGSFGAEYRPRPRFAVFGEIGVQYVTQESTSSFPTSRSEATITQVGPRSAVGLTFYF